TQLWSHGGTLRLTLVSVLATALIAGTAVLASLRQQHASASQRVALAARSDGFLAEHALMRYWKEREAVNEYLLRRHPALLLEMAAQDVALDNALTQFDAGGRDEARLVANAMAANDIFVAEFRR